MSREHGFYLVVIIPWYRNFDKHIHLLREVVAWDDITVVDLPASLNNLPRPRIDYFFDRLHPNREGHRHIAAAIGEKLRLKWESRVVNRFDFHN
jgi:hypothetical protein